MCGKTSYFHRHKPIATFPWLWSKDLDQMQCWTECHEALIVFPLGPWKLHFYEVSQGWWVGIWRTWGTTAAIKPRECGVHTRKALRTNPLGCSQLSLMGRGYTGGQDAVAGVRQWARWLSGLSRGWKTREPCSLLACSWGRHHRRSPHTHPPLTHCAAGARKVKTQHAGTRRQSPFLAAMSIQCPLLTEPNIMLTVREKCLQSSPRTQNRYSSGNLGLRSNMLMAATLGNDRLFRS